MLKQRIKKLEDKLQIKGKIIKIWNVKYENAEMQIADIIAGRVKHPDGSPYSESDLNCFIDIDMFTPKSQA